ncbi:hypothetical protein H744_1c0580 [Photobacterium gaetbulicola Gung47]|uniref:Sel1 repeat family protein n=1 Tax=Photobacterium gaetbulicola Gung47 TaxID=658445 RepID=A0A0C5WRL0_9GAMM|nr:sel1 repeat family protein [Photobacterium gaetbulicola]AJR05605.1 hypothetical protein H744_1c0580 [Photobacterium gaetbulicola Gung47]
MTTLNNLKLPTIFFILGLSVTGCSSYSTIPESCTAAYSYSEAFLQSHFYQGWKILNAKGKSSGCEEAISYFEKGIQEQEVTELSNIYAIYCNGLGPYRSRVISGRAIEGRLSLEEFNWISEWLYCDGTVEQYSAGQMLLNGYLVDKNQEAAIYYMTLAAKKDYPHAQMQLALSLLEIGEVDNAILWLRKAYENGYYGAGQMLEAMDMIYQQQDEG